MNQREVLANLFTAMTVPESGRFISMGLEVGRLFSDHGLPIDMALSELSKKGYTRNHQILILYGAGQWFIEHKRNSGGTDKSIERQRQTNQKMLTDFMARGETGVY